MPEKYAKPSHKALFLAQMESIIPWNSLSSTVAHYYPTQSLPQKTAPDAANTSQLLRIYFLQYWFSLSDASVEDALYDSLAMRKFAQIDLQQQPAPGAEVIRCFRYTLEENHMGGELLRLVNIYLKKHGVQVVRGSLVEAGITLVPIAIRSRGKPHTPTPVTPATTTATNTAPHLRIV